MGVDLGFDPKHIMSYLLNLFKIPPFYFSNVLKYLFIFRCKQWPVINIIKTIKCIDSHQVVILKYV